MRIEPATKSSEELVEAFRRLIPQLSRSAPPPAREDLDDLVRRDGTQLLVAREGDAIVGALTLDPSNLVRTANQVRESRPAHSLGFRP